MKKFKYIAYSVALAAGLGLATSCVDADIDDALDYKEHYKTVSDADKAVLGAYSSFLELSGQMVVLNELRGDLMDLTTNASTELQEISANSSISDDNRYADPTPYYKVIQNCNDALANFIKMYNEKSLTRTQFNERYSDLVALRSYVYLQLAAQFGQVPYITEPVVTVADMMKGADKVSIEALIKALIADMTATLPTGDKVLLNDYSEASLIQNELSGYDLKKFFINKHFLLGDLYLWDNQYENAASQYKEVMNLNNDAAATANSLSMKVSGEDTWTSATAYSTSFFQIFFLRYQDDNVYALQNQWVNIFHNTSERRFNYEWVWTPSYDEDYVPAYPFYNLFATKAEGGDYQLMPSAYAVDSLWGTQTMRNGFTYDARGNGSSYVASESGEGNEVYKYLAYAKNDEEKAGRLLLQRAGLLHLRYCEAVNRAGHPKLAYALLNQGLRNTYGTDGGYLILGTEDNPIDGVVGEPYYFACSWTEANNVHGYRREPWRSNRGIRGRAALVSREDSKYADKTLDECTSKDDSIKVMEKIIFDELALETAFEGNRYPDLVRLANRLEAESAGAGIEYMKEVMAGKNSRVTHGHVNSFDNKEQWFLPFRE